MGAAASARPNRLKEKFRRESLDSSSPTPSSSLGCYEFRRHASDGSSRWPFRSWRKWVKTSEEITGFQPTVDFLHLVSAPSTSLSVYVRAVIDEVMTLLFADRCSIFFVNEVREEVWCVGSLDMEPFSMPWDKGIVGMVATEGKMVNLSDAHAHDSFDSTVEKRTGYTCNTLLAMPVKNTLNLESTIGVIQVLNKLGSPTVGSDRPVFSEEDAIQLQKIAMVIGDSFYRQRFKALENLWAVEDNEVQSVLDAHRTSTHESRSAHASPPPPQLSSSAAIMASISSTVSTPVHVEKLSSCDFSVLRYTEEQLERLAPTILRHAGCVDSCNIPWDCLQQWCAGARNGYNPNPFHNWYHGFQVYQMCFHQLSATSVFSNLSSTRGFGLLIAAMCHDIAHPGVTNSFLIRTGGQLAITYNDVSVLENHHASMTCQMLRREQTAIGSGLDAEEQVILRKTIIKCILATDMSLHRQMCQSLLGFTGSVGVGDVQSSEMDRDLLLHMCIHSSDLSAQVLPWADASQWEERISLEFLAQAEQEIAAGLTPEPFMQFEMQDLHQRGKLQRDFIDFVLIPLWEPYSQMIPALVPCFESLMSNRNLYDKRRVMGRDVLVSHDVDTWFQEFHAMQSEPEATEPNVMRKSLVRAHAASTDQLADCDSD
eukprot:TRINITY_DN63338_c0_g1_i1.p1 TRINITY_DN63338_c0_g1~~TRINITY_DN63338_c0_g1_i1.p1  ORF type:complete len:654 (-),score=111.23 TRINITY_DN63338_c0_g1_i1:64-2025(-)